MEAYFDHALSELQQLDREQLAQLSEQGVTELTSADVATVVRRVNMIIDAAWHLADALYPARQARYSYKVRPFWWWHFYKDILDPRTHKIRESYEPGSGPKVKYFKSQLRYDESFNYSLAHAIADFPLDTFHAITKAVNRDLHATAPSTFDPKIGKRPLNILSISGYSGKAIAESIGKYVGHLSRADIVHVDAFDLSCLVGEYLGQNWAYSRGAVSMMGFRAAELNGKIAKEPEVFSAKVNEDDLADNDTSIINVRTSSSSLEDELSKIKQGSYDCFSKWEGLKIDKILDHIIHAADRKHGASDNRPVLIHVHDFIELSMTLEGSLIVTRLRALVDAAWQRGKQIAILATSSCDQLSEEYHAAVRDLSLTELVITRHIQPDRAEKLTKVTPLVPSSSHQTFNLLKADIYHENAANIDRMLRVLDPNTRISTRSLQLEAENRLLSRFLGPSRVPDRNLSTIGIDGLGRKIMQRSLLPLPEVYHIASAIKEAVDEKEEDPVACILERDRLDPLRQPSEQLDEDAPQNSAEGRDSSKPREESKTESRGGLKLSGLNEYEKRIASGHINRENLRTTFADVHAPPETISALKLLTSLALIRPDAFSYGVLAHDKITGCLLYGPPGTGKTMLAKAVAKDSGANMLEISGANINDKWVGEAEKLIRAVFTLAKKLSPCVIFIDEADALLANRSMFRNRASHREHINQFLKEWDGMEETNAFIMVATNRPFDLDDAVLRRLPRKILVDLPLRDDRASILRLLLKDETLASDVSVESLADRTPYYSGSDLKNVCVAAAMAAVEEENDAAARHVGSEPFQFPERRTLTSAHFERSLRQIPASISEDMVTLRQIRRFDEEYGNRRKGGGRKTMGFGVGAADAAKVDAEAARVRPPGP
jgi:hypothetical protein